MAREPEVAALRRAIEDAYQRWTVTSAATTTTSPASIEFKRLLPPGDPAGSCAPAPLDGEGDAVAAMSCGPNVDPGGPTSSNFTLSKDRSALRASFTDA